MWSKSPDRVRFGPAGFPVGAPSRRDAISYLRKLGLGAMEYQAVRAVPKKLDPLKKFGEEARKKDIILSLHAPYAINLSSPEENKREASIQRLVAASRAAAAMGAFHVTFHPGFYSGQAPEDALRLAIESLKEVREILDDEGLEVELGPETTGKPSQLGSLEEVLAMARAVPGVRPTVDFAHIHAREGGSIAGRLDYARIIDKIEEALGTADGLVIHFTEVELTKSGVGEKRHHELGSGYGPPFRPLAEEMAARGVRWLVISESPILEEDSLKMKEEYLRVLEGSR